MNKAEMRTAMQRFLDGMGGEDLADRSAKVSRRLEETGAWMWMDVLLTFLSMPHEIGTRTMIEAAFAAGKSVAVPLIESGDIRFLVMPPDARTPPRDRWGIPVPDSAWQPLDPARAGRILVAAPGLAFDRTGNRLGRGKGYYDRFLGRARASGARFLVIGVCFADQLVDEVPHSQRDQPIDGVVTETETILFGPTNDTEYGVDRA
jgi:5-formyltetrahydrofolate cyclo-ligase